MKVYSIGREQGCDIFIDDRTDVISRRHAILSVKSSGKMTITDQSSNGTYVNGIRISPNVPVPVTRKDNISFAHVARLDWNRVPKAGADYLRWVAWGVVGLLIVVGAIFGIKTLLDKSESNPETPSVVDTPIDSTEIKKKAEDLKKAEQERSDSIRKAVKDSIEQAQKAKTKSASRGVDKKSDKKSEKKDDKKDEGKKNEEQPAPTKRMGRS